MNYYYDIILNWNEENAYEFYEWNDTDCLELVKKIPYIKINHKAFLDLYENKVKVSIFLLNKIKNKTLISDKSEFSNNYMALFTDGKNITAIEFNNEGISISRSNLELKDEVNAREVAYSLKEEEISYEIIEVLPKKDSLRQISETKHLIMVELNNLYNKKDLSKLRYLYYEYARVKCEDIEVIYNHIMKDLNNDFKKEFLKLYDIIKLSYQKA